MGDSDKPMMRYSTSEMARDYLELLEHVGWVGERELNIVGISMGGMIAQEIVMDSQHLEFGRKCTDANTPRPSSYPPASPLSSSSPQPPA